MELLFRDRIFYPQIELPSQDRINILRSNIRYAGRITISRSNYILKIESISQDPISILRSNTRFLDTNSICR